MPVPASPIAFQLGPFEVRWYGVLICCGMIAAFIWAFYRTKQIGLDPDHLLNILLLVVPLGIIGARLYFVVLHWDVYGAKPSLIPQIWRGGLAIHGGIIAGLLVLAIYSRYQRQSLRRWGDILTPGLILAQGIGRWGNYFNQEAYGYETDLPWAMLIDGAYRHPTFLYESIWDILGFLLLAYISKKNKYKTGDVMACYMIWYSVGRFFIERFRTDSLMVGDLRAAMVVSAIGVVAGLVLLWLNRRYPVAPLSAAPTAVPKAKQKKK